MALNAGDVAADVLTDAVLVAVVAWYLFVLFAPLLRLACCP
jgi:hypothetical protein